MKLTRIYISNFRNFHEIDVTLDGNIVIVGENRVGKSNLLYALRLIFDPSLPDSARQLGQGDFWDGLGEPLEDEKITVFVELTDFEDDLDLLAQLTDFRLDDDPHIVRLTYEFRPIPGLDGFPKSDDDYEFLCYGGEVETKRFGHDVRRRIAMDLSGHSSSIAFKNFSSCARFAESSWETRRKKTRSASVLDSSRF